MERREAPGACETPCRSWRGSGNAPDERGCDARSRGAAPNVQRVCEARWTGAAPPGAPPADLLVGPARGQSHVRLRISRTPACHDRAEHGKWS